MKRILCATDLSSRSELAVSRAAALATQFGAELCLLHVVDEDLPRAIVDIEVDRARAALESQVSGLEALRRLDVDIEVRSGSVFQTIVATAEASSTDLLVMGAHRKRILKDVIVGTTIERVMRTGRRPVLMVNVATPGPYGSVLLALDASQASAHAVSCAKALGLLDGAHVSVVHAFEPIYRGMLAWAGVQEDTVTEYSAAWAGCAETEIRKFLRQAGLHDPTTTLILEEGPPALAVKRVAERLRPGLLVIGTHGRSGLKRALLGSVAERVVSEVDDDILAVPGPAPPAR